MYVCMYVIMWLEICVTLRDPVNTEIVRMCPFLCAIIYLDRSLSSMVLNEDVC